MDNINNNFEDNMKALEEIANELENGKLNLDESVKKFEDGIKISKVCNDILEKAEKRISILINKENSIIETDFESNEE